MFISNFYKKIYDALILRSRGRALVGYSEKHHIIPKSLGGTDDPSNIVILTACEHFRAHLLLCKITTSNDKFKMLCAAKMMANMQRSYQDRYKPKSRIYEWLKIRAATAQSNSIKGKTYEELYGIEKATEMRRKKALPRGPQKAETISKRTKKLSGMYEFRKGRSYEELYGYTKAQIIKEKQGRAGVVQDRESVEKRATKIRGIPKSDIHKQRIANSLLGKMKGVPKSEETKQRMRKPKSSTVNMRKPKSEAHKTAIAMAKKLKREERLYK